MKFYTVHCPICITKFPKHEWIKDKLLDLINSAPSDSLVPMEWDHSVAEFGGMPQNDDIARLDWKSDADLKRPWVKYFWPYFENVFGNIANKLGYTGVDVKSLWFQQYLKNGTHGWHSHSNNYTGVYYLEFPEGSPATEISQNGEIVTLNIKEGDFVTFPAFLYHRAPKVLDVDRKTIISFNVDFKAGGNYV